MARLEDKLERFEKAVLDEAMAKSKELLDEMEAIKQEQIALTENAALTAAYEIIQGGMSDITTDSAHEISQMRLKQKQEYLSARKAYENSVFENVKQRLIEYTKTDAYAQYLLSAAKRLAREHNNGSVTLTLKQADKVHEQTVKEGYNAPCTIAYSDDITIGGILLRDDQNGFVVDLTLDTRLKDQKDWFYQNCKL